MVFPEHIHHPPAKPLWAVHGSRVLTLVALYRRHALSKSYEPGLSPPDYNRRVRSYSHSQRRIGAYLGAVHREGWKVLGLALAASQELGHLPIEEAVRRVNGVFGWNVSS